MWLHWYVPAKEFPIPESHATRAVDSYQVLVELLHLNDSPCPLPTTWLRSCLVLYPDFVLHFKRRETSCVLRQTFGGLYMAVS